MRSKYAVILLACLILFLLAACGNGEKTVKSEESIQNKGSETTAAISAQNGNESPNPWVKKGEMPIKLITHRAAVIEDKIYILGVMDEFNDFNDLYEYDPRSDKWTKKSPSIAAKGTIGSGGSLAVSNGKLYVFGGGIIKPGGDFQKTYNVQEYDPVSDKWVLKGELPNNNYAFGAAAVGKKIYIVGGELSAVNEYDPLTNEWASRSATPDYFQDAGTIALNGKIYAVSGAGTSSVCEYDPQNDKWSLKSSIITKRIHLFPAAVHNRIYAINGITMPDMANSRIVEVFDTEKGEWTSGDASPVSTYSSAIAEVNGKIYLIGGMTGEKSDEPTFGIYEYDPDGGI